MGTVRVWAIESEYVNLLESFTIISRLVERNKNLPSSQAKESRRRALYQIQLELKDLADAQRDSQVTGSWESRKQWEEIQIRSEGRHTLVEYNG